MDNKEQIATNQNLLTIALTALNNVKTGPDFRVDSVKLKAVRDEIILLFHKNLSEQDIQFMKDLSERLNEK